MSSEVESIVDRIVDRLPIEPRLARLVMEATIEEVHRLMWLEDSTVDAAQHLHRNLSPESCAHLLSIMQCAFEENDVGDSLYEEYSQRLPQGRKIMIAKVQEWCTEKPESRVQIDAARRSARKTRNQ